MVQWIQTEGIDVVAIEGSGGYTRPLEHALRKSGITFYSIDPYRITRYREAVLGQHKNNQKDAVAVAFFVREQANRGNLETYRRRWFPDETLRPLVRLYEQKQREATREINRLWQRIQNVSGDLFLALRKLAEGTHKTRCLTQQWLLKLFAWYPDLSTWQAFTREGIAEIIEEHRTKIIDKIMGLKNIAAGVPKNSAVARVELQVAASTALAERKTFMFNHRLKNSFFTAARNYTLFNPDSHLTGYYRSLKAKGMKQTELYKRVARALVRRFYRDLKVVAAHEMRTRQEGIPEPEPAEKTSLKQPLASTSKLKYGPTCILKSRYQTLGDNYCKKEEIKDFP